MNYLREQIKNEIKFLKQQEQYLISLVEEGMRGNHFLRNIKKIQSRISKLSEITAKTGENKSG